MKTNKNGKESFALLAAIIFVSIALTGKALAETPLEGAWLLIQTQDAEGNVDAEPLPGLIVFTSTHYSTMFAIGDKPRALMDEEIENQTDAQIIEAYNSIIANTGRYDVDGNNFTTRAFVAKNPNYMNDWPENMSPFSFKIDGDTLVITDEGGYGEGRKFTYRRVEGSPPPWE